MTEKPTKIYEPHSGAKVLSEANDAPVRIYTPS